MIDLKGRVALVTGGSRGIGRACVLRLAEAGADLVINYITSESAAREVASEVKTLGRRALVIKADVSRREDTLAMVEFAGQRFGSLDILISNAASGGFRAMASATEANFAAAMNTNVAAFLWLVQAALPLLQKARANAKVIAISSRGAEVALPGYGLIGASKAALESMVRHAALEWGAGINFNVVQAGLTATESALALATAWADGKRPDMLAPGDVADTVLFLASALSNRIQGQTFIVDSNSSVSRHLTEVT